MRVVYTGSIGNVGGQFIGGLNIEPPPLIVPSNTNYSYSFVEKLVNSKTINCVDGLKMLCIPYDYSCFEYHPPNYLNLSNVNNKILTQCLYLCGYGLPNTSCVKIVFDRVFEGNCNI